MYLSFSPSFDKRISPAWIEGWQWHRGKWRLRVLLKHQGQWAHVLENPANLHRARAFEPSTPGMKVLGGENRRFDIEDLSALSPLLEPREVLGPMLRGAASASHAIYVAETVQGRLLFPAWVLIDHLWIWSAPSLDLLLTPNSLNAAVGATMFARSANGMSEEPGRATRPVTKMAADRLSWLANSQDARDSWGSVLTNAYQGRLALSLPKTRMSGWAWGVEVRAGLMVCELASVETGP